MIFFGALLISAAPIGLYALDHPDIFLARLAEVTTYGTPGTDLGQSILLHLKMFFIEGDPLLRYNVPGRPYFTLPEGLLLLVGIGAIVRRLRRREGAPTERAAYVLALLSPLMVIPGVIATGGLPPNHMRTLGMVPLIFILGGIGFEAVWGWLGRVCRAWTTARGLAGLTVGVDPDRRAAGRRAVLRLGAPAANSSTRRTRTQPPPRPGCATGRTRASSNRTSWSTSPASITTTRPSWPPIRRRWPGSRPGR